MKQQEEKLVKCRGCGEILEEIRSGVDDRLLGYKSHVCKESELKESEGEQDDKCYTSKEKCPRNYDIADNTCDEEDCLNRTNKQPEQEKCGLCKDKGYSGYSVIIPCMHCKPREYVVYVEKYGKITDEIRKEHIEKIAGAGPKSKDK